MKILGVLVLFFIISMVGCADYDRYDRDDFHHSRREAREHMREAREEFRRSMREAHEELRRNFEDAREDWRDHHWHHDRD